MFLLPVGYENFAAIQEIERMNFIDKSLFIKEILDDPSGVILITRPRRFGKTLALSMLHCFLADIVYGQSTQHLFEGLKILNAGDDYVKHQGQYPVIFLTLKDIKASNYDSAMKMFANMLRNLYREHRALLSSPHLSEDDKDQFLRIVRKEADESELQEALKNLMNYLYLHHNKKPWLLIDEYDTPIQAAYAKEYYDPMIQFMRGFLGTSLKTNPYLEKAVITGILRVSKESLFSGLNNLKVCSLLSQQYSEYFGFTEKEVSDILEKAKLQDKAQDIKEWFNGYQVGNTIIYNPWSIANCIDQQGAIQPYWINTSDNQLIKDLLIKKTTLEFKKDFEILIKGGSVEEFINEGITFGYLKEHPTPTVIWNLLLMAGYLKPIAQRNTEEGTYATLSIPNKEVRSLYRLIIKEWLSGNRGIRWYNEFINFLLQGNIEEFKKRLEVIIFEITSYHDFAAEPEAFYQGLILGLTSSLHGNGTHEIQSNREAGLGRFDIILIPEDKTQYGIIIELKVAKENESLDAVAKNALKQIQEKRYVDALRSKNILHSVIIGIGFRGKDFALYSKEE